MSKPYTPHHAKVASLFVVTWTYLRTPNNLYLQAKAGGTMSLSVEFTAWQKLTAKTHRRSWNDAMFHVASLVITPFALGFVKKLRSWKENFQQITLKLVAIIIKVWHLWITSPAKCPYFQVCSMFIFIPLDSHIESRRRATFTFTLATTKPWWKALRYCAVPGFCEPIRQTFWKKNA